MIGPGIAETLLWIAGCTVAFGAAVVRPGTVTRGLAIGLGAMAIVATVMFFGEASQMLLVYACILPALFVAFRWPVAAFAGALLTMGVLAWFL